MCLLKFFAFDKLIPYLNRHRLAGRVCSGVWVNNGEGTRQIDSVTSGDGVPTKMAWVSLNREWRLFIKNTGFCKVEKQCIGSDACPALKSKSL